MVQRADTHSGGEDPVERAEREDGDYTAGVDRLRARCEGESTAGPADSNDERVREAGLLAGHERYGEVNIVTEGPCVCGDVIAPDIVEGHARG